MHEEHHDVQHHHYGEDVPNQPHFSLVVLVLLHFDGLDLTRDGLREVECPWLDRLEVTGLFALVPEIATCVLAAVVAAWECELRERLRPAVVDTVRGSLEFEETCELAFQHLEQVGLTHASS